ncbi:putative tRNA methyltransferase 9B [Microcaecilia unicolor]|uniref:Probable tRNA methyltransferase 9B n=1 Tax=Microcaecilia unicolor TaxID=1415580 RepID=A0A6P7X6I3_9AMPH|nr:probable tRNA methyltransferase 9B [Microcaecilia unicolor]
MEHEAHQLEQQHVHGVYESTASCFNDLQSKAWPRVRQFLLDQKPGSLTADIGCGTGKYLSVNYEVYNLGCDYCGPLVEIAKKKGHEVMVCDNLNLPYRSECFDTVISIGVIHHFSTKQRRIRAIKEMSRVLVPGGQLMLYVWAMEQKNRRFEKQDVFVPWNKALCSRPPSETSQSGNKSPLGQNIKMQATNKQARGSAESIDINNLRQNLDSKRSHSADNYGPAEGCCMKFDEDENRFYAALGRSLRSWFFSRSLDEFTLKKHIEKIKPLKSIGGWANSAISAQPSRHCSLDLGHRSSLLQGESFDDDEVFMENASHKKSQWFISSDVMRNFNGMIQSNKNETSFQNDLMENGICNCKCTDERENSTVSGVLKRNLTTESADGILDAAVVVEDQEADMLDAKAYMRYYHVFREGELSSLLEENVPELQILNSCYDHGNWCVIATKPPPNKL